MTGKSGNSRDADVPLEATDDILAEDVAAAEAETKAEDKEAAEAKAGKSKKNAEGVTEKHKAKAPKINFKWSNVDPIIKVSFVVFMLACVIVLGSTVYDKTLADHTSAAAEYGDKVIVDYVGSYYVYYEEDGAVIFDTTLKSVGGQQCRLRQELGVQQDELLHHIAHDRQRQVSVHVRECDNRPSHRR